SVAGNIKAYVNGVLVSTVDQSPITISGTGPFKVGGYSSSTGITTWGIFDEFRMYNRALSATATFNTWNQSLPIQPDIAVSDTIAFNEDINVATVSGADFNNSGTASITIGTITETAPGVFTVQVTPTTPGTLILRIPTGAVISDVAGNNLVVPVQDNDTLTVVE